MALNPLKYPVMVHNVKWRELKDGRMTIDHNIKVKVVDFGVAEV